MDTTLIERIFRALFIARERGLTNREIANIIYADREDGGPLGADKSINGMVWQLRRKIIPHGATVDADYGPCSRYRLVSLL